MLFKHDNKKRLGDNACSERKVEENSKKCRKPIPIKRNNITGNSSFVFVVVVISSQLVLPEVIFDLAGCHCRPQVVSPALKGVHVDVTALFHPFLH